MPAAGLFVVSAPSGAGKTTLCQRLLADVDDLAYSVSHTTRPPRQGEVNGRDYFFVSEGEFREMIEANQFLEWAEVYGRYYGTGRRYVQSRLDAGQDVLIDVDIAGARQIKQSRPEAAFIFIAPPSLSELRKRLQTRSTEDEEQLKIRLKRVQEEVDAHDLYDYLIINDDLEVALADLAAVVRAERNRMERHRDFWGRFHE
jgi:guanylate kinase